MNDKKVILKRRKYLILVLVVAVAAGFGFFAHAQTIGVTSPSVPTGIVATLNPPSRISVSWSAATESSGTIEGYYVYRNGGQITTTGATSFIDSGLVSGVYIYTVAAYDANGNMSAKSSSASVTLIADTMPPSTPTGMTITGTTSTNSSYTPVTLTISWGASTDNVGVAGYYVYRDGMSITTSTSLAFTGTSITDTVTPGTYAYTVTAYDAAQNFSNRSVPVTVTVGVDTTAPSVPMNVSAQQVSATGVNLSWATSTDNVGVAGYQVYRNGIQIASTTGSPYADTGLSANIAYTYAVAAYDIAGNVSAQSALVKVTVQVTNGPSAPSALSATLLGTSTVKLSWVPAADVLVITGYTVYRNGARIVSVTSANYLDGGLASGTYVYNVSATDISGAISATSSPVSIVVPAIGSVYAPIVATPIIASSTSVAPLNTASGATPATTNTGSSIFTQFLYFGLRNAQVESLQSLLAGYGYLASANATGFFGNLTEGALQKFQCDQNIVCTGGAGWGTVGPKTRNVLNNLSSQGTSASGGQGNATSSVLSASSVSALNAEIQALQAELANLERQLQSISQ